MSSLMGWLGTSPGRPDVLRTMAEACSLPESAVETCVADGWAVAVTSPLLDLVRERLATSADGQVMVAFAGHLCAEDEAQQQRPAAYCLERYQQQGLDFVRDLNGSFALALHDAHTGQLHLITDRLGTYRLCYHTAAPLVFGTEVKAILEYPGLSRAVNPDRLREFLVTEHLAAENTYYDHIKLVPAATILTVAGAQTTTRRYWLPQFTWHPDRSLEDGAQQLATALRNAVRRVTAGHARAGLMLSGGLDSRAIACASETALTCMTIHASRGLEVSLASRIAATLGYSHEFVPVSADYPLELVTVGTLLGEAINSFHHAQGWLTRPVAAREQLSLTVIGDSLDVFFSGVFLPSGRGRGLARLLPPRLPHPEAYAPAASWVEKICPAAKDALYDSLLRGCSAQDVKRGTIEALARIGAADAVYARSNHDAIALFRLRNFSKGRTHLNVSCLRRHTQAGVPGYDNEIVDAFLALPPPHRYHSRAYTRAIRILSPEVASIPRSLTCLPLTRNRWDEAVQYYLGPCSLVVAEARTRACGYRRHDRSPWPRMRLGMTGSEAWRRYLEQRLASSYLIDTGIVDGDRLRQIVEDQLSGRRRAVPLIGAWVTLEEWLTHYQ